MHHPLQEDVVMGTLTVRENLRFSAALRLPSSVLQSEKEARVTHLIKELGLTKVADSKVRLHTCVLVFSSSSAVYLYFSREDGYECNLYIYIYVYIKGQKGTICKLRIPE